MPAAVTVCPAKIPVHKVTRLINVTITVCNAARVLDNYKEMRYNIIYVSGKERLFFCRKLSEHTILTGCGALALPLAERC